MLMSDGLPFCVSKMAQTNTGENLLLSKYIYIFAVSFKNIRVFKSCLLF